MSDVTTPPDVEPPTTLQQTRVKYALPVVARAAAHVMRRYPGRGKPQELYAVGTFALYRLAREFRDEMSHDFADIAYRRVRDAMRDSLRLERKQDRRRRAAEKGADLFLAYLRDDEYNVLYHDDADAGRRLGEAADALLAATFAAVVGEQMALQAEDPAAAEEEYRCAIEALGAAVQKLPDEQAQTLKLVYRDGKMVEEIANALDLSYRTVQRRHADALVTLRDELGKLGVSRSPPPLRLVNADEAFGTPDSTDPRRDP